MRDRRGCRRYRQPRRPAGYSQTQAARMAGAGRAGFPRRPRPRGARAHLRVGEGDVLLVRVGRARRRKVKGGWEAARDGVFPMAGLDPSCLTWLHERRIALLGSDGVSDVFPSGYDDVPYPIHVGAIALMGVHLLDNADLDQLAATCARLARYEFQFVMLPLLLPRGTASPVNPIALF